MIGKRLFLRFMEKRTVAEVAVMDLMAIRSLVASARGDDALLLTTGEIAMLIKDYVWRGGGLGHESGRV
jgi:hypothetical protein